MQIQISGNNDIKVTPALEQYVSEKLERIHKKFDNITKVHVTLTLDKKFQQKAEAHMHLARGEIHAASEDKNMYAAIDSLVDKLNTQVVAHKELLTRHRKGNANG